MKQLFFLMFVLILAACAGKKSMVAISPANNTIDSHDSTEYELLIFDTGFDSWYTLKNNPTLYRNQAYYETWNKMYVSEWNNKVVEGSNNHFFETIIGYEPGTDYGFALNHKLFGYFQYVEHKLKIPILTNSSKSISF